MRSRHSARHLLGNTSVLALSIGAVLATAAIQPANAAAPVDGLWGGGGSLSSLAVRQIFDCYNGAEVAGDGYATASTFASAPPSPGLLPTTCATHAGGYAVEGLYGAVGSGRGQQAYIANDALQLLNGGPSNLATASYPNTASTPATKPSFIDTGSTSTEFNTYPYPGLTFAGGDNPLPSVSGTATLTTNVFTFGTLPTTGWATGTAVANVAVAGYTTASYNPAKLGPPVQLPLFEVPVAIAVNTNGLSGLQSATSTPAAAGGAIQLSTAQVCAIFSGTVTDWSSAAPIATLDNNGNLAAQAFYADNVSTTSTSYAHAYASSSTPIHVTYRADGSGTSYIFTNYLKANCVALDSGSGYSFSTTITSSTGTTITTYTVPANHYAAIFGAAGLPSTSFSTLANAVTTAGNSVANWQSGTGSSGVAKIIGTGSASPAVPGAIGYLSADFTTPYANAAVIAGAPNSASVQNENQRENAVYHPANGVSFIAPTPTNADNAYISLDTYATINTTSSDYNNWNLYGYTYPATYATALLQGKSILGIPAQANAYPVVGTTYLYTYSCYANASSVSKKPPVVDLLRWYYANGSDAPNATVEAVLENNGFHGLNIAAQTNPDGTVRQNLANLLYTQYLNGGTLGITKAKTANTSCASVSPGA